MSLDVIIKQDTRILTPETYEKLRDHLNPDYRIICDVMLYSALRVEELRELAKHPQLYKPTRRCIAMQSKKPRAIRKERDVLLTFDGCSAVELFLKVKPHVAERASMGAVLKLAAKNAELNPEGISPKMFRKTYLTWLVASYPENYLHIAMSAGHTINVLQNHYAAIAFQREDVAKMRYYTRGWGE